MLHVANTNYDVSVDEMKLFNPPTDEEGKVIPIGIAK